MRRFAVFVLAATGLLNVGDLEAQAPELALEPVVLLRAGLRAEPDSAAQNSGFELFDAQLGVRGEVGKLLEYRFTGAFDTTDEELRLLDALLTVPFMTELKLHVGQYKVPFSLEELLPDGDVKFARRAQAVLAIAPDRQLGAGVGGAFLEERLTYGAGLYNGNGRTLENDNNAFLYAGRVQFNNIGPIDFFEEFVFQIGANLGFSRDADVDLSLMGSLPAEEGDLSAFSGERWIWGVDVHSSYRGFFVDLEFLSAELEPEPEDGPKFASRTAEGGYAQIGYQFLGGFVEGLVRYDGFSPLGQEALDYLLFGSNVYLGFNLRFSVQVAAALAGSPPGPELAGGQVIFYGQLEL